MKAEDRGIYSSPRIVTDITQCYFYHTIDLPNTGTIEGNWDLRGRLSEYLGGFDFRGKRVLDVGTANGILSFSMEKSGAEVISFDLDKHGSWDIVPFANWSEHDHIAKVHKTLIDHVNNAYWFCHRLYKSKAKVVYGNVYNIPEEIGFVDVTVYGSILLHLRDPFLALQSGLKLTREAVIVTEPLRGQVVPTSEPYMGFLPDAQAQEPKDTWWDLRPELIVRMVGVLGFEETIITYHTQKYEGRETALYTVVGRRTNGPQLERPTQLQQKITCQQSPARYGTSIESSQIQQQPAPQDLLQIVHGTGDMEKDWDLRARTHARLYIDGSYYQTEEEFDSSGARSLELWILRDIALDGQAAVLEIGCGIGRILKPLAGMVREVHGVDVSGEMLVQGTERLKDYPNINLHKTSGADLTGLPDHYFDLCFSLVTFRHIPQKKVIYGYFKEVSRVLQNGGLFWFQVDGSMDGISRQDNAGTWEGVVFTETEIRHYLSEYGFEILDLWGHETLDFCVTARLKQQESVADTTLVRFSKRSWNENILRAFLTRLCPTRVEERLAQLLEGSLSVRRLANSFLETRHDLSIEEYVRDIYQVFLGREPDMDGYHSYVDAIRRGTLRREVLIDAAITSYEFDRMLVRKA